MQALAATHIIERDQFISEEADRLLYKVASYLQDRVHGEAISGRIAEDLRDANLGGNRQHGLLTWIARNIGP
jgi:hypothetical protein